MNKKYIKKFNISNNIYIGLKSYTFGKEEYCYTDLVKDNEIVSKSKNKIYETTKGKYIEKHRRRYYLDNFE